MVSSRISGASITSFAILVPSNYLKLALSTMRVEDFVILNSNTKRQNTKMPSLEPYSPDPHIVRCVVAAFLECSSCINQWKTSTQHWRACAEAREVHNIQLQRIVEQMRTEKEDMDSQHNIKERLIAMQRLLIKSLENDLAQKDTANLLASRQDDVVSLNHYSPFIPLSISSSSTPNALLE